MCQFSEVMMSHNLSKILDALESEALGHDGFNKKAREVEMHVNIAKKHTFDYHDLTNCCLIAPPSMADSRFKNALVYIARHDHNGALGLIINQPLSVSFAEILDDLEIQIPLPLWAMDTEINIQKNQTILYGGPLRPEVGFVLHTGKPDWHSSVAVTNNVCLTTSKDIIEAIASNQDLPNVEICLGYASWEKYQLETEMTNGDWLITHADNRLLFDLPHEQRWEAAADKVGINFDWWVDYIGSA